MNMHQQTTQARTIEHLRELTVRALNVVSSSPLNGSERTSSDLAMDVAHRAAQILFSTLGESWSSALDGSTPQIRQIALLNATARALSIALKMKPDEPVQQSLCSAAQIAFKLAAEAFVDSTPDA